MFWFKTKKDKEIERLKAELEHYKCKPPLVVTESKRFETIMCDRRYDARTIDVITEDGNYDSFIDDVKRWLCSEVGDYLYQTNYVKYHILRDENLDMRIIAELEVAR